MRQLYSILHIYDKNVTKHIHFSRQVALREDMTVDSFRPYESGSVFALVFAATFLYVSFRAKTLVRVRRILSVYSIQMDY